MMKSAHSFQKISDDELHHQTLRAAESEKQATLVLLEHLAEVDHRRLHLKLGYSSLWEYTHKALSYSESQASERVNSMRLMVKVPEVKQELKSGQINLTVISKLASHVRRENLDTENTVALLSEVKSKPTRQVEKILAQESTAPAKPDFVKIVTPTITRITIEVDDAFMDLLNRVKELKGNHAATPKELFQSALKEFVKKREVKKPTSLQAPEVTKKMKPETIAETADSAVLKARTQETSAKESSAQKPPSRYIPIQVKTQIRLRSGDRCEYVNPQTQKRCDSKTGLQWDHHPLPFALGGESSMKNLRQVCSGHNQLAAIHVFGRKKIERYFT